MATAHIIGAGVAGLAAAVELSKAQFRVVLHEQSGQAGGRCRSFHDSTLECTIDNGNHLLLSGNQSALSYLDTIGASDQLVGPENAEFPFVDLKTGERWSIELDCGSMPWWILNKDRRVPGTRLSEYLSGLKLLSAGNRTVKQLFKGQGQLYDRFWDPFTIAVVNTSADLAAARLLTPVIRETLAKGAKFSRPLIARHGLSTTFVTPAIEWLEKRGSQIRFNDRVSGLSMDQHRVVSIETGKGSEPVGIDDVVVMAVPAWMIKSLIKDVSAPDRFVPIVNVHFRVDNPRIPLMKKPLLGMLNSLSQWLFVRDDVASVTISAGDEAANRDAADILDTVWREIAPEIGQAPDERPVRARVIKERRATFLGTPAQLEKRSPPSTKWPNLVLCGDWVDNGLPSTIEGSIRSGQTAAKRVVHQIAN